MSPPPNDLYAVLSFIGFVLCAIPLYWHPQAWNTGTCLYMIWTCLGCLLQSINSIVWNKNMINRAPVYCDISTRIQVALNVSIPACSLCINRRLYKIVTLKAVLTTYAERRRAFIHDMLIGIGLPILQIIAQYVVSTNRYDIYEDFGPSFSIAPVPQAFILFFAWPLAIGTVSLYYCVITIYTFHKRESQFRQIVILSSNGLSRGRYFRLMALSAIEILGTIPLATYFIVSSAKAGVIPWTSWADVHAHYSEIDQIPSFIWKNDPQMANSLEIFRWSLVACAFIFFTFFGLADEARQRYHDVYTSLAGRISHPRSILHRSSRVISEIPPVVTAGGEKLILSVLLNGQPSISIASDLEHDFRIEHCLPSDITVSSSMEGIDEPRVQGLLTLPAEIMLTAPPASLPPHFPETTKTTMRAYSGVGMV